MGKNIPDAIKPELYRLYSKPYQIFELYLTEPYVSPSHRFVASNKDIVFGGNTYTALAIKRSPIKSEEGTIINEIEVGLDNVDLEFKTLVASGLFNKKRCVIKLVFGGFLSNAANYILFVDGDLDEPKGDDDWVTMTITPFPMFEREFPKRVFQVGCNWTFGDANCTMNKNTYKGNKVVGIGTNVNTVLFEVADANIDDYWLPGYIEMTSGDLEGQARPIAYSTNERVILRIPFDIAPQSGDTFVIYKLCSKTPGACQNIFDNYEPNYGGYPHVPKKPVI